MYSIRLAGQLKIVFKAYMNNDIPLETAATFFSNDSLSKTGYWRDVCHDFICIGLLDLCGARIKNYKMKSSCPQWDSDFEK